MEEKVTSHIIKGLVLGIISVFISVVVHTFNLYENPYVSLVTYGVFMIGIIYSTILFANQNGNKVGFGNIFAHGFKTSAVVIVITVFYTVLAVKLIFPEFIDITLNISRKRIETSPNVPKDAVQKNLDFMREYFLPFAIGMTVIILGFFGLISSLIGAAVAKKNTNPFENQS